MSASAIEHVQDVKRRHEAELLRKPNVVAVGIGYRTRGGQRTDEVGIIVSVTRKLPLDQLKPQEVVPAFLEGVAVDVVETGVIRAGL